MMIIRGSNAASGAHRGPTERHFLTLRLDQNLGAAQFYRTTHHHWIRWRGAGHKLQRRPRIERDIAELVGLAEQGLERGHTARLRSCE